MTRITRTLWKGLLFAALTVALARGGTAFAADKLGDVMDGGMAVPVHLIPLLDEQGEKISLTDEPLMPFSLGQTCGYCHDVNTIGRGWHFNAADTNVGPGRVGQAWFLADGAIATQMPLSYRDWKGAFKPQEAGLSYWQFVGLFGRHLPGGGPGELLEETDNPDEIMRAYVSGRQEMNCLACHSAGPGQDQADYALQMAKQNYRWAATSACEFAFVKGSAAKMPSTYDPYMPTASDDPALAPPTVVYQASAFDDEKRVLFDIVTDIPEKRCYFCHSNVDFTEGKVEKWHVDEDVHIEAGLTCVDCHRNGLEHKIIRGYEGEDTEGAASCSGCHLGDEETKLPVAGRFAAPAPKHPGIPPVHFDKLTCTACHSGPWPQATAVRGKTSRAHALGTLSSNKTFDVLPHVYYPVFAKYQYGKIGPHKLVWPAYWAVVDGNDVKPLDIEVARAAAAKVITKDMVSKTGDWPAMTEEQTGKILELLAGEVSDGRPGYVTGGRIFTLDEAGKLASAETDAGKPYMWPMAHNVRPAAQSLGVRSCEDCHATDSGFFFGKVPVDSPIAAARGSVEMIKFEGLKPIRTWFFAFTFVFRPWLKVVTLLASVVILGVLVLFALKALGFVAKALTSGD